MNKKAPLNDHNPARLSHRLVVLQNMIILTRFDIRFNREDNIFIESKESPLCPKCSGKLSGYDSRLRKVKNSLGSQQVKPKRSYRRNNTKLLNNFPEVVEHAIILRRECPSRSVSDIIRILELEELITPETIHRSTLQVLSW